MQDGKLVKTDELEKPVNVMEINLVNVLYPSSYRKSGKLNYDYSTICDMYKAAADECTELDLFDVSSLADVVGEYREYFKI